MKKKLLFNCLIPGIPITKKNSQQMVRNPKTGRWFPVPSKAYKDYEKTAKAYILDSHPPSEPINEPVQVTCMYRLPLNRDGSEPKNKPDLTNLLEATDDILVKYKVLEDDNVSIIQSHDRSRVRFTNGTPGVMIWIYGLERDEGQKS